MSGNARPVALFIEEEFDGGVAEVEVSSCRAEVDPAGRGPWREIRGRRQPLGGAVIPV